MNGPLRDLTQALIAYRGWHVMNGRLTAYGVGPRVWPTFKPFSAICESPNHTTVPHDAPHIGCTCGLYGFADEATLMQVLGATVLGRVALWGRVVVCGLCHVGGGCVCTMVPPEGLKKSCPGVRIHGYRAEYAYPQVLYYVKTPSLDNKNRVRELAATYGIDAVPMPDRLSNPCDFVTFGATRRYLMPQRTGAAISAQMAGMAPILVNEKEQIPYSNFKTSFSKLADFILGGFPALRICLKCTHRKATHYLGKSCLAHTDYNERGRRDWCPCERFEESHADG